MYRFSPLYPTMEKKPLPSYPKIEENLFHFFPQRRKTSSIVSHNVGKPLPLYPTTEENLFHCGIQWKKTCGIVGYNAEDFSVLYPLMQKNPLFYLILLCCIYTIYIILYCYIQRKYYRPLWATVRKKLLFCVIQYTA